MDKQLHKEILDVLQIRMTRNSELLVEYLNQAKDVLRKVLNEG